MPDYGEIERTAFYSTVPRVKLTEPLKRAASDKCLKFSWLKTTLTSSKG